MNGEKEEGGNSSFGSKLFNSSEQVSTNALALQCRIYCKFLDVHEGKIAKKGDNCEGKCCFDFLFIFKNEDAFLLDKILNFLRRFVTNLGEEFSDFLCVVFFG